MMANPGLPASAYAASSSALAAGSSSGQPMFSAAVGGAIHPVATVGATAAVSNSVTAVSLPQQPVASGSGSHQSHPVQMSTAHSDNDLMVLGESHPDTVENGKGYSQQGRSEVQRTGGGWPKGRRRVDIRDDNAPRAPLTGYIRFLNEHREKVRAEHPTMPFAEVTKLLGSRWSKLSREEKQHYLDDAQEDKARYAKELNLYRQTDAYRAFVQKQALVNQQREEAKEELPGFNIPIFTEEFLDYNKARDLELQQLRKSNTEYEQQNNVLGQHVCQLKGVVSKLEREATRQQQANLALQSKLEELRALLTASFARLPLPGTGEVATVENIDAYMAKLQSMVTGAGAAAQNEQFLQTVRATVANLDIQRLFTSSS